MKGLYIFVGILVVLIIGFGLYFYFYYEKPLEQKNKVVYANLNILAKNGDKQIPIGFKVFLDSLNNLYDNGTTSANDFTLSKIPINHTVYIENYNLENETYYTQIKTYNINTQDSYRIEFDLISSGNLSINKEGFLDNNCNFNLTVQPNSEYRDSYFCTRWSEHIVNVNMNYTRTGVLDKYIGYTKCWNLGTLNKDTFYKINVSCDEYGILTRNDFIDFLFSDKDVINGAENLNWSNPTTYNITV